MDSKKPGGKLPPIDLDDYRRDVPEKLDAVTTSLHLDRRHMDFVRKNNLNLSRLVRDFVDQLISMVEASDEKTK